MIPNKYAYFVGCLLFFIPWAVLFWHRKDLRKEMLIMGLIAGVVSQISAYAWTADWWRPQTITGTRVGIEDYILGISNGGIAAVLYVEVFHRGLYKNRAKAESAKSLILLTFFALLMFYVLFRIVHITSFWSCIITLLIFSGIMLVARKELILSSLINGALMVLVAFPIYMFLVVISPGAAENTYIYNTLSGIKVYTIPIEEFIFYYVFGFMVALAYEYWHGLGLRKFATVRTANK